MGRTGFTTLFFVCRSNFVDPIMPRGPLATVMSDHVYVLVTSTGKGKTKRRANGRYEKQRHQERNETKKKAWKCRM